MLRSAGIFPVLGQILGQGGNPVSEFAPDKTKRGFRSSKGGEINSHNHIGASPPVGRRIPGSDLLAIQGKLKNQMRRGVNNCPLPNGLKSWMFSRHQSSRTQDVR